MTKEELNYIRNNPYIYRFLREESYYNRDLYLRKNYLKEIENLAKEKYGMTFPDRLQKVVDKAQLLKTILDVIE